jgi:uncharacterized FlaG/YvyC family protein
MGIDGFSMSNLGLGNEMTSVQMATQAEQLAKKGNEFIIKDVQELAQDGGVKRKKEQSESEKQFNDALPNKKNQKDEEEKNYLAEKDFEGKDPKEFSVRINPETEMVELFNNKEQKVLETIPPKNLMELISKLDGASGILVNRKI